MAPRRSTTARSPASTVNQASTKTNSARIPRTARPADRTTSFLPTMSVLLPYQSPRHVATAWDRLDEARTKRVARALILSWGSPLDHGKSIALGAHRPRTGRRGASGGDLGWSREDVAH